MSGLVLSHVSKTFGGLTAVRDVSFEVPEGAIFGVIGPNGAGKTTVFNVVTGVYPVDAGGSIRLGDRDLGALRPAAIAAAGVARTFQNIRLFSRLSVLDNVLVATETTRTTHLLGALLRTEAFYDDESAQEKRAFELLDVFGLKDMAGELPSSLSYGNQRRLEIARAMMLKPKVLLLDEPAAGMKARGR